MDTDGTRSNYNQAGNGAQPQTEPAPDHPNGGAVPDGERAATALAEMRDRWMRAEAEIANFRSAMPPPGSSAM